MSDKTEGVVGNFAGKAEEAASNGSGADEAKDTASGIAAGLQETARKVGVQACELGSQAYKQAADAGRQLKEQPLASMAIVGMLGGILGFLIGRVTAPEPSLREYAQRVVPRRYR
jgi:ElaB/YqjD/DUF883 family membrane-anchored ribosome-binding protein